MRTGEVHRVSDHARPPKTKGCSMFHSRIRIVSSLAILAGLGAAHAAITASPTDKPQGWASQNGGTTGGTGGWVDTAETISELQTLAKKSGKGIIYIKGTMGSAGAKDSKGGDRIVPTADKTILGLPGATIKGGFDIKVSNIILRNVAVWGPGAYDIDGNDPIHIEGTGATNIWVDHVLVSDGQDGNLDITNGANYVTVSWSKFSYTSLSTNHQYCNLIGSSETKTTDDGKLKTTMVNNWWADGVVERMPRVRFGEVHVVNNLVKTNTSNYAVRAGQKANILVEKNLFVGTKNPINIFTDETGQRVKVTSDNVFQSTSGTKVGINEGQVFTPPYTLTGLFAAADLTAKLSDAGDGAGPTIDKWGTSTGVGAPASRGTEFHMERVAGAIQVRNWGAEGHIRLVGVDGRSLTESRLFPVDGVVRFEAPQGLFLVEVRSTAGVSARLAGTAR